MTRYSTDRYEHPDTHRALRSLRTRQGLTRPQVAQRALNNGDQLSVIYLAQCEADPSGHGASKSARQPSKEKLAVMVRALGATMEEFEALLDQQADASTPRPRMQRLRAVATVNEGTEWDDIPAPLWERQREELVALYDELNAAARTELLAHARRLKDERH